MRTHLPGGGDPTELAAQLAVVLEIILVNLCSAHTCLRKKYGLGRLIAVMLPFTAALIGVSLWTLYRLPFYGNGNGLFVFIGFLYLIPLHFLYDERPVRSLIVVCSSWVYTLIAFSVSVQMAYLLDFLPFTYTALICQTLLLALTFRPYQRFLKNIFLYLLQNVNTQTQQLLTRANMLWFVLIFCVHLSYVFPAAQSLRVVALALLFLSALLTYHLLYHIIKSTSVVERLELLARFDNLTALKNRRCFYEEAEKLIDRGEPFILIFMDLDNFKSVNDVYGHPAGDEYLRSFAERTQNLLEWNGTLYRLAGDEFVCVYKGDDVAGFLEDAAAPRGPEKEGSPAFLGASTGYARFPGEAGTLNHLISLADQKMYRVKRKKGGPGR